MDTLSEKISEIQEAIEFKMVTERFIELCEYPSAFSDDILKEAIFVGKEQLKVNGELLDDRYKHAVTKLEEEQKLRVLNDPAYL